MQDQYQNLTIVKKVVYGKIMVLILQGENNMISKDMTVKMKGLAIMMIVLHHSLGVYFFSGIGLSNVTLFCILSGYGLTMSYKNDNKMAGYWHKRFSKIFIPYFLVTLAYITYNYGFPLRIKILSLLGFDMELKVDSSMWYVTAQFAWYIIFFLIMKLNLHINLKIASLFILGIAFRFQKLADYKDFSWHIMSIAFAFPIGVFIAFYGEKIFNKISKSIILGIIGLLIPPFLYLYFFRANTYFTSIAIIYSFLVILIFKALEMYGIKLDVLRYIGIISFEIYIIAYKIQYMNFITRFGYLSYIIVVIALGFSIHYITSTGLKMFFDKCKSLRQ
jgi:hypothetical protein